MMLMFFHFNPVTLCVGGETVVHPLPQTAVLLDRQVDRSNDGGHSEYGGEDKGGAG